MIDPCQTTAQHASSCLRQAGRPPVRAWTGGTHAGSTREEAADVFLSGLLFFDLGSTGLPTPPTPGAEVWTRDFIAGATEGAVRG